MTNRRSIHERVLSAGDADELAAAYADWATSYDADLTGEMGYRAHTTAAETLRDALDPARSRVLDAGCGTGLVGVELARLGFTDVDGVDYSADMLAEAETKGVYARLAEADLMAELDIPTDRYDAVICVGTFTLGHVGPSALGELIRVTRPGGYLCFTVRDEAWERDDYAAALRALTDAGRWSEVSVDVVPYIEEEGSTCRLCLFRVATGDRAAAIAAGRRHSKVA